MAGGVFINYRREDSAGFARLIYDRLSGRIERGQIFFDVDNMPLGADFVKILSERVGSCDALIAVIGRDWLTVADDRARRRLDDPNDFVRVEIEAALARNIPVIPVLVAGASIPKEIDLPDGLKPLARRHGIEISHTRFDSDAERLTSALAAIEAESTKRALEAAAQKAEAERLAREAEERAQAERLEQAARQKAVADDERLRELESEARRIADERARLAAEKEARDAAIARQVEAEEAARKAAEIEAQRQTELADLRARAEAEQRLREAAEAAARDAEVKRQAAEQAARDAEAARLKTLAEAELRRRESETAARETELASVAVLAAGDGATTTPQLQTAAATAALVAPELQKWSRKGWALAGLTTAAIAVGVAYLAISGANQRQIDQQGETARIVAQQQAAQQIAAAKAEAARVTAEQQAAAAKADAARIAAEQQAAAARVETERIAAQQQAAQQGAAKAEADRIAAQQQAAQQIAAAKAEADRIAAQQQPAQQAAKAAPNQTATVANAPQLNMRSEPNPDSDIKTKLYQGNTVHVIANLDNGWSEIEADCGASSPSACRGYVNSRYLAFSSPQGQGATPGRPPAQAIDADPRVRECDRQAASQDDNQLPSGVAGINFDKIDSAAAIPACRTALAAFPNSPRLQFEFGQALEADGSKNEEALNYYRKAAGAGYAVGAYNIALMYDNGVGVKKDRSEAAKWYRMAADRGNPAGATNLGWMFETGNGVTKDVGESAKWYRKGADGGDAKGAWNLGLEYEDGRGVPQSDLNAARYLLQSLKGGEDLARKEFLENKCAGTNNSICALIQQSLIDAGLLNGAADGKFGPLTIAALKAYVAQK